MPAARVLLRSFRDEALPALVDLWNEAVAGRRNARTVTAGEFRRRVLDSAAFDARGLILAWSQEEGSERLVGFVHAFKPPPQEGLYTRWGEVFHLGPLYVTPPARNQGTGSRLLQAAENHLYYCPVHALSEALPAFATVEGLEPPFCGTSERMGVSFQDRTLILFLTHHGYRVIDPGSVSMVLDLETRPPPAPAAPVFAEHGLRLEPFGHDRPLPAREPAHRQYYTLIGNNGGRPYGGLALIDAGGELVGHASWYPIRPDRAAFTNFRLAPHLRGQGCGRGLLDCALHQMATLPPPLGGFRSVELYTHVVHHASAVALYEASGFRVDETWVNLVKT